MADGTLERVRDVNKFDRRLRRKRETDLPCRIGAVLEPLESGLEGLINFLQSKSFPGAAVDR